MRRTVADRVGSALDWFFRDRRTGRITVAQWPNLPLLVFAVSFAAGAAWQPSGEVGSALRWIAAGSLAVWAADELARGVNPWRRCLGACVLCYLFMSLLAGGGGHIGA